MVFKIGREVFCLMPKQMQKVKVSQLLGPKLWNSLQISIQNAEDINVLNKELKTYPCKLCFNLSFHYIVDFIFYNLTSSIQLLNLLINVKKF